jgi:hypothetical protein
MPVPTISISQRWLIVVSTVIILLSTVLLPHAAQAQAACRLPARLQVGEAVELIGSATRTVTCQDADSAQVMVQTALPANADLRIVITAQVWSAGAQPSVTVDMLDIGLAAR